MGKRASTTKEVLTIFRGFQKLAAIGSDSLSGEVTNGYLIGGVGFTRTQDDSAFSDRDSIDMSALCLHLSTWFAIARAKPSQTLNSARLTPRELQIAELVAEGLTNENIGKSLWIRENSVKGALKRMFRKLEVSSRAELVAKLSSKIVNR